MGIDNKNFNNINFRYIMAVNFISKPVYPSEWLLFNVKRAILQLFYGDNKLHLMRWCPLCARPTHLVRFQYKYSLTERTVCR